MMPWRITAIDTGTKVGIGTVNDMARMSDFYLNLDGGVGGCGINSRPFLSLCA